MKKTELFIIALIIFFSSLLVSDPLFHKGIFTAHDIEQNIARFGAFYRSLSEGNIIPRWADGIANGYGGPILMFSYSMPYYIASIFRFAGFTLIDSIKILIVITHIGSALLFYTWLKRHLSTISAFGGSLLYVYAPYRISDIYARGSIPEITAFFFIPLVLLAIHNLSRRINWKNIMFMVFSYITLLLSHPFFMMIFSSLFILYTIYLWWTKRSRVFLFTIIISLFFSFGITSFYFIPLQLENKYTHYDISPFNGTLFYEQYNTIEKLFTPQWSFLGKYGNKEYITYQLGVLHWFIIFISLASIVWLWKRKEKRRPLYSFLTVSIMSFLISIFFMLPISFPIYKLLRPLQQIQFPWRFLSLSITSTAIILAILLEQWKNIRLPIVISVIIVSFYLYLPYSKGHNYVQKEDRYYLQEFETNTEGPGTQPRWAAAPELYKRPTTYASIIEGKGSISIKNRKTTKHLYQVESSENTRIVDNTFYFPGWVVLIDGKPVNIEFQDQRYRGLITFNVPQGNHNINIVFGRTKVRLIADLISVATLLLLLILSFRFKRLNIKL